LGGTPGVEVEGVESVVALEEDWWGSGGAGWIREVNRVWSWAWSGPGWCERVCRADLNDVGTVVTPPRTHQR
jgi:hypothetical protein